MSSAGAVALAQTAPPSPAPTPGFSLSWLRNLFSSSDPLIAAVVAVWGYALANPPVAALVAAAIAGGIAIANIGSARQMARVTATFNMAHGSVWDADYIRARNDFASVE